MKVLEDFKNYLKIKDYSDIYEYPISVFIKYCQEHTIDYLEINHSQLSEFFLYLKEKEISNGYLNNFIKAIRCFYSFLFEAKLMTKTVRGEQVKEIVFSFKQLKTERKIKDYYTLEELEGIIEKAITYEMSMPLEKVRAILLFMFYTGIRKKQLLNLKRKDIDLSKRTAIIRVPTKNDEEHFVFFPKKVVKILEIYFSIEPEESNAFNMTRAKVMHFFNFLKNFVPKEKNITPHTLRHSFANMLAENGVDIRVAQKLLGHKSIQSTAIYYDPDRRIVEKIYRERIK